MIWALLFSLIFGGSESVLMNPKFKKHIRKHVEEKERKQQILDLVKVYEKEAKRFHKKEKKKVKEMNALNADRTTSVSEFERFFKRVMEEHLELAKKRMVLRLTIQEQIEKSEWDFLVEDSKIVWNKNSKKRVKYIHKLNKSFEKAIFRIKRNILNEKRKQEAISIVEIFKADLIQKQKDFNGLNISERPVFQDKDVSESDLQSIQDEINLLRWDIYNAYIKAHKDLVEVLEEDEWPKIVKSINKIF